MPAPINGTPNADTIPGTSGGDVINGLGGNDKIDGGSGNDAIDGGAGNDIIKGGDGDDTITGGLGNDTIVGGAGQDVAVYGGEIPAASQTGSPIGSWNGAILTLHLDRPGTDTLNQVEILRFGDMDFAVTGYNGTSPYNVVANLGADSNRGSQDDSIDGNVRDNDYDIDGMLTVTGARLAGEGGPRAMPVQDPKAVDSGVGDFVITGQFGVLRLFADGSYSYQATGEGTDHFQYSVTDGGVTRWADLDLTATHLNHAPQAGDGAFETLENQPVSGAVSASDVDGDTLTYSLATTRQGPGGAAAIPAPSVEHGTLDFHSDGTFTYTPDQGFFGTDSFIYQADDGHGGTDIGTVTLTVDVHNFDPVATDGSFAGDEDSTISGQVAANDQDSDPLNYILGAGPAHGSLSFNSDGSFVYTPNADYNGSDSFTYRASDGTAESGFATVSLDVTPVNDVPAAYRGGAPGGNEDHAISGHVGGLDKDGDALTFELVDPVEGLTLNPDGSWNFDPTGVSALQALDYYQYVSVGFNFRAYDGQAWSDPVTETIFLSGVNEPLPGTAGKDSISGSAFGDSIDAQGGDDVIHGYGGGDMIWGGEGSDKLYGGDGMDQIWGGQGADTVNGEAGSDGLFGESGNDTMDGGDGNDVLSGGDGNDVVKGGAGNDNVNGDAGDDDVQGGAGDDWINGWAGADRLSGGTGADHFYFEDGHLGSTLATTDTITDFKTAQGDILDFQNIDADMTLDGDQAFALVGSFSHHAGEMTMTFNAGVNTTVISMDTNGDGVADYLLQLTGNVSSTAGWLL
jgi:Ca2+-binding RTX toxin-like protein